MKRPGKQDRPTAEKILDAATPLFYTRGLKAVTLDEVAADADVTKRTLYYHFPSKDDLVIAYMRRWQVNTKTQLTNNSGGGVETVLAAFRQLQTEVSNRRFRGCPIVNAVAEINDRSHAATKIAMEYKEDRRAWFEKLLREDHIPQAAKFSKQLMVIWEGAMVRALVTGNAKSVSEAYDAAATLLTNVTAP